MNFFRKWVKQRISLSPVQHSQNQGERYTDIVVHADLTANIDWIKQKLGNSTDLSVRQFKISGNTSQHAALLFMEGLADTKNIVETLVKALDEITIQDVLWPISDPDEFIDRFFVPVASIKKAGDMNTVLSSILSGDTIILFESINKAVIASTRKWKDRSIQEPNNEPVVRGPRDGFVETLRTNTALIRRRIKDPNLWMETLQIGRATQTDVAVMYIKGIADPKVVNELRSRLQSIDVDGILESGYIEEFIEDKTLTVFPLVYSTERPDVIAAELLEGRVAVFCDNTPIVLIVPAMFVQFLQAAEDHYQRWDFATFIRIIRYIGLGITLLAPSLYIAITTFHQEILPPELLMSIAAAREGVPFPAFIEAVLMEITFELLREAGVRMPKTVGQAISIVGTLVIGQAAVEAGIVSPAMVIIVSITAIANFVLPAYSLAISFRILRFFLMALAASLGIFGILLGLFIIVFHLCSLRSFGVSYLSSFAPFHTYDQKDVILRVPRWAMFSRPRFNQNRNYIREGEGSFPIKKDSSNKDISDG